jgi:hypothetical protein
LIVRADNGQIIFKIKYLYIMTPNQQFEVFWPRSPRQTGIKPLAGRLESLNGRTIAQIWDYLFKGDVVFAHLEEAIKAQFPAVKFVSWREFGSTHGGDEKEAIAEFGKKFRELGVDAVISGMAC